MSAPYRLFGNAGGGSSGHGNLLSSREYGVLKTSNLNARELISSSSSIGTVNVSGSLIVDSIVVDNGINFEITNMLPLMPPPVTCDQGLFYAQRSAPSLPGLPYTNGAPGFRDCISSDPIILGNVLTAKAFTQSSTAINNSDAFVLSTQSSISSNVVTDSASKLSYAYDSVSSKSYLYCISDTEYFTFKAATIEIDLENGTLILKSDSGIIFNGQGTSIRSTNLVAQDPAILLNNGNTELLPQPTGIVFNTHVVSTSPVIDIDIAGFVSSGPGMTTAPIIYVATAAAAALNAGDLIQISGTPNDINTGLYEVLNATATQIEVSYLLGPTAPYVQRDFETIVFTGLGPYGKIHHVNVGYLGVDVVTSRIRYLHGNNTGSMSSYTFQQILAATEDVQVSELDAYTTSIGIASSPSAINSLTSMAIARQSGPYSAAVQPTCINSTRFGATATTAWGWNSTNADLTAIGYESLMVPVSGATLVTAIGAYAGRQQNSGATAVGHYCGSGGQGINSTGIGAYVHSVNSAGATGSTAIGAYACADSPGSYTTAIGYSAGRSNMGEYAVAVGYQCAMTNAAPHSVSFGANCAAPTTNGRLAFGSQMEVPVVPGTTGGNIAALVPIDWNGTTYRVPVVDATVDLISGGLPSTTSGPYVFGGSVYASPGQLAYRAATLYSGGSPTLGGAYLVSNGFTILNHVLRQSPTNAAQQVQICGIDAATSNVLTVIRRDMEANTWATSTVITYAGNSSQTRVGGHYLSDGRLFVIAQCYNVPSGYFIFYRTSNDATLVSYGTQTTLTGLVLPISGQCIESLQLAAPVDVPALCYVNSSNDIMYVYGSTQTGGTFTAVSIVTATGYNVTPGFLLLTSSNFPAIVYIAATGNIAFVSSNTLSGSAGSWSTPIELISSGDAKSSVTFALLPDGRPAVSYIDTTNRPVLIVSRTATGLGGSWTKYEIVPPGPTYIYTAFAVRQATGRVYISYIQTSNAFAYGDMYTAISDYSYNDPYGLGTFQPFVVQTSYFKNPRMIYLPTTQSIGYGTFYLNSSLYRGYQSFRGIGDVANRYFRIPYLDRHGNSLQPLLSIINSLGGTVVLYDTISQTNVILTSLQTAATPNNLNGYVDIKYGAAANVYSFKPVDSIELYYKSSESVSLLQFDANTISVTPVPEYPLYTVSNSLFKSAATVSYNTRTAMPVTDAGIQTVQIGLWSDTNQRFAIGEAGPSFVLSSTATNNITRNIVGSNFVQSTVDNAYILQYVGNAAQVRVHVTLKLNYTASSVPTEALVCIGQQRADTAECLRHATTWTSHVTPNKIETVSLMATTIVLDQGDEIYGEIFIPGGPAYDITVYSYQLYIQ